MLKAAVVAVMAISLGSCSTHEKAATYRDKQYGWTISYPASMTHRVIEDNKSLVSWHGVLVANSARARPTEGVYFRRFPPDGAAFALVSMGGGPAPDLSPPEARFPLSRDDFKPIRGAPPPTPLFHGMIANGEPWQAVVWFGPKASSSDKDTIWKIVESIKFPPQRRGTTSGEFYVLGEASNYPVGSATKFRGKESADYSSDVPAFYLVHAPKGMYAVGWPANFESTCHMGFDRQPMTFFCSTHRGQWNRMGDAIQPPVADQLPGDALWLGQAKIGRDGQVLVGNWFQGGHYAKYQHRYWP